MDAMTMQPDEIRRTNTLITMSTRRIAAELGCLWYAIEKRELWKAWGYEDFRHAVEAETDRAYSSVREFILQYRHFVVENGVSFDKFIDLVEQMGIRKVSYLRQEMTLDNTSQSEEQAEHCFDKSLAESCQNFHDDHSLTESCQNELQEPQDERILSMALSMKDKSTDEAKEDLKRKLAARGIEVYAAVHRQFQWTRDQDDLVQEAIKHAMKRCPRQVSPSEALAAICAEYCSLMAVREPPSFNWNGRATNPYATRKSGTGSTPDE